MPSKAASRASAPALASRMRACTAMRFGKLQLISGPRLNAVPEREPRPPTVLAAVETIPPSDTVG